ncbi:MAG: histidine phosphatase family protein [Bacteroidales bacterium]|nr:histidine phosphatase family protein [Bacteroidales bacterium]
MNYRFILPVLFFMVSQVPAGHTQDFSLKDLKEYYKNQEDGEPLHLYHDTLSKFLVVILIRHGEPDLDKKGWRNRDEAIRYMQNYDSATVIPFSNKPLRLEDIPVDTIIHSSLPRARHTAQLAFGGSMVLMEDCNYREFERKTMRWCNIKMPTKCWTSGSRILWLLGLNDNNIESFGEAKDRAKNNAAGLAFQASIDGMVILVAHGLHNKYVKKYLRKAGWKLVYDNGNGYLSVKVMALVPESD